MTAIGANSTTCWTPAWVQSVTTGRWLTPPSDDAAHLKGISIDSRTTKFGQIFLAIKGENFDGHDFVESAFESGAAIAIIERNNAVLPEHKPGILLVENTLTALHNLARSYRQQLFETGCTVIAVAGSNGKTTTRNLIYTVLASTYKGTQSVKSFNNHLGVPLTILGAREDDRFLIAEVGTNHPGEIDALSSMLQPDAAVITSIGHEHMEFFNDLQGVASEEATISQHLTESGKLFIQADAYGQICKTSTFNRRIEPVIYGRNLSVNLEIMDGRQSLKISKSTVIALPLLAPHDACNALAAVEIGRWMGVKDSAIKSSLENIQPMPGRLETKRFGPVTVIDDTYNANPDSMRAALQVLAGYPVAPGSRRVVVLADMLELGAFSETAHHEVGKRTALMMHDGVLHHVVFVGPLMASANETFTRSNPQADATYYNKPNTQTMAAIAEAIRPGDVVLCKGSRGLKLERLMPLLHERFG